MTFDFEERQGDLIDSIQPTDSIVLGITEDMKLLNKGKDSLFLKANFLSSTCRVTFQDRSASVTQEESGRGSCSPASKAVHFLPHHAT